MSALAGVAAKPASGEPQGRARRAGLAKLKAAPASEAGRRLAVAILEVLAGGRTPTQAAESLKVSLPRYYALEERALRGLVEACAPRPKGRQVTPERELEKLQRELGRLEREKGRAQALLRAAQRTVGLGPPIAKPAPAGSKRRRRRPVVRALRAAKVLESGAAPGTAATSLEGGEP